MSLLFQSTIIAAAPPSSVRSAPNSATTICGPDTFALVFGALSCLTFFSSCRTRRANSSNRCIPADWRLASFSDGGRVTRCSATVHFLHQFPLSLHRWTIVLDAACVLSARWPKFLLWVAVPRKAPARHINRSDRGRFSLSNLTNT